MATPPSARVQYYARRRRRAAQSISAYSALIAAPEDLGAVAANSDSAVAVTLPADGRLAIALDDITVESDLSIKDGVNQVFGPGGVADFVQKLDITQRGREVVVHRSLTCPSGACSLYVLDDWSRPLLIAFATFT